jgi:cysteine desulfurase
MSTQPQLPIYLDYQATTPLDPRVLDAMMPFFTQYFGNPHSTSHSFGWMADEAINKARTQIANLIGAQTNEIVFTSGATESNNLAIKGIGRAYRNRRNKIITIATEHKCVLESAQAMADEGMEVAILPVQADGLINLDELASAIDENTLMVSVMAVNNEIGVVQPIMEIGALCRSNNVFFHTDAAQAAGKIPIDVQAMNIDMMSLSAHKIYGPKGVGAFFLRQGSRLSPRPVMSGGGQESGLRSGTLSPALCVGFGHACEIAANEMNTEASRIAGLADQLLSGLTQSIDGLRLNGHPDARIPGNLNISIPNVDGEMLLSSLCDIAVSSGAACASAVSGPSYVLQAIGVSDDLAQSSLRIGLGRQTTTEEIAYAVDHIVGAIHTLRNGT